MGRGARGEGEGEKGLKNTSDYVQWTSFRREQFVQFLKVRNLTWPVIRKLKAESQRRSYVEIIHWKTAARYAGRRVGAVVTVCNE